MVRFWTCHWQSQTWRGDINTEYKHIRSSGSNSFRRRGVSPGDVAYIISLSEGHLLLGGRMVVANIVSRDEAARLVRNDNLYDAREWIVNVDQPGTPLNLHRRLAPAVSRQVCFVSPRSGLRPLRFVSDTHIDNQATRGVQELTQESAALLDRIIEVTDQLPRSSQMLTVTAEMITDDGVRQNGHETSPPSDHGDETTYSEGGLRRDLVTRYERDPKARRDCIQYHGDTCVLCGFSFGAAYGNSMEGFIHVHHLVPLSSIGAAYEVDPVNDLRPVCPNCHAVLHHRDPPYSLDEVAEMLSPDK